MKMSKYFDGKEATKVYVNSVFVQGKMIDNHNKGMWAVSEWAKDVLLNRINIS